MKTIIAGPRHFAQWETSIFLIETRDDWRTISEVVRGNAPGVDTAGARWAWSRDIPVTQFRADWKQYGHAAGPIRNQAMAAYAEALLRIWDGTWCGALCRIMPAVAYRAISNQSRATA